MTQPKKPEENQETLNRWKTEALNFIDIDSSGLNIPVPGEGILSEDQNMLDFTTSDKN